MNLTTKQREGLRAVADQETGRQGTHHRTLNSLVRQGLVYRTRSGWHVTWALTSLGCMVHEDIMGSGDGPEALKALLRF